MYTENREREGGEPDKQRCGEGGINTNILGTTEHDNISVFFFYTLSGQFLHYLSTPSVFGMHSSAHTTYLGLVINDPDRPAPKRNANTSGTPASKSKLNDHAHEERSLFR